MRRLALHRPIGGGAPDVHGHERWTRLRHFPRHQRPDHFGRFNPDIGDFQIFVANPDGSHLFQLTTVPSEVSDWSPDGTRIAYDFFDGQTVQIATINPDGTGNVQLTHQENVFPGEPAWSPDATVLAFDSDAGNHPAGEGIYIMDASTGTVLSRQIPLDHSTSSHGGRRTASGSRSPGSRKTSDSSK
jgi:Tol biopolymer transport system component